MVITNLAFHVKMCVVELLMIVYTSRWFNTARKSLREAGGTVLVAGLTRLQTPASFDAYVRWTSEMSHTVFTALIW